MPPQNAVELVATKSDNEKPKNGNMNNNNNKDGLQLDLKKPAPEEPEPTRATIIIPPDGGFGWVVMMASFCCNVVVDGIVFSSGMFIDPISESFGASKASVALVGSLLSGFYLIIGPFVSALANRYGFRKVTMFGSVFSSAAFALCYFAPNVYYLHLFYGVLGGIGFCFIYMPSVIIVGYYFERWRPLATGIALCGSGVGCFIMAPISNHLITEYGWKSALLTQSAMILLCGFFAIFYLPIEPTVVSDIKEDELPEKKSLMGDGLPSPAFTKVLPEGRFAYSVPNSSHNTWMGTANNTTYPTAAEIFKGSGANLDRRPSQTSGVLTQVNINSTTKKLEQFKQAQKRSGHVTPTDDYPHPPPVLSALNAHHELGPVGEAEEVEENENGTLLEKNEAKAIIMAASTGRRHTVSGRRPGTDSQTNSRRGSKADVSRPMYRDDIFFSGSLAKLPQYRSQTSLGYHMSVTHMPTRRDIEEDEQGGACKMCPEAVRRTLSTMLDVSLFKDYSFILLVASGAMTMMGFFVPFIYITARAKAADISEETAVFFVSSIGVFNTVARIVFGALSSVEGINALHLNNIFIFLGGIATMFSGFFMAVPSQYAYTAIFGMACACLSALRSIIVVDLLGLDKLTNAFGIILLFQGIAAVIGSPLAGYLFDVTGSYDVPFLVAGGLIAFSAVLTMPLKMVKNWQQKRDNRRKIAIAA